MNTTCKGPHHSTEPTQMIREPNQVVGTRVVARWRCPRCGAIRQQGTRGRAKGAAPTPHTEEPTHA